jgi:hypothetical protein
MWSFIEIQETGCTPCMPTKMPWIVTSGGSKEKICSIYSAAYTIEKKGLTAKNGNPRSTVSNFDRHVIEVLLHTVNGNPQRARVRQRWHQ